MNNFSCGSSLAVSESAAAGVHEVPGLFESSVVDGEGLVFCHFSLTHSPNPSLAPPGERGGLHVAAFLKMGNLVIEGALASQWPQHIDGRCKSIFASRQLASTCLQQIENPRTQFDGNVPKRTFFPPLKTRPHVAVSSLSAPAGVERVGERGGIQRKRNKNASENRFGSSTAKPLCAREVIQKQLASTCLQQIENPHPQFDGNAPLRTFFPPMKTRPHVAASSLSAPAGVERVGERGGIQRLKNKNAADNRRGNSSDAYPCIQKRLQKQERTMHIARGLAAKMTKRIGQHRQIAIQELTA